MPLSHRKLAAWYRQLAEQLNAGLPLAVALRMARGTGAPSAALDVMAQTIERGGTVDDALRTAGSWLPLADLLALSAAADAGRMPRALLNLAARHEQIGAAKLRILFACAYPAAVLHLGVLLLPVVGMIDWEKGFQWSATLYVRKLALLLVPLWGLGAAVWIMARRQNPVLMRIARLLPAIGSYMRTQALADFAFALGNFLEAGVPIGEAWAAAGLVTRSREIKTAARAMEAVIARGEPPGAKLGEWRVFPEDFVALYRTGESTGQLDATLLRVAAQQQEAANRALGFATLLYPGITFLAVAVVVVYYVVSIYGGYLKMLGKLAE